MLFYTKLFFPYSKKLIQIFLLQSCFVVNFPSVTNFLRKRRQCTSELNKLIFYIIDTFWTIFFLSRNNSSTMKKVTVFQPAPMMLWIQWVFFNFKNKKNTSSPHTHTHTHTHKQIINQLVFSDTCRALIDISRKFFVRMHSTEWYL